MQIGTISKGSGLVGETIGRRQRTLGGLITMHRGYLQTTQSQTRGREWIITSITKWFELETLGTRGTLVVTKHSIATIYIIGRGSKRTSGIIRTAMHWGLPTEGLGWSTIETQLVAPSTGYGLTTTRGTVGSPTTHTLLWQ